MCMGGMMHEVWRLEIPKGVGKTFGASQILDVSNNVFTNHIIHIVHIILFHMVPKGSSSSSSQKRGWQLVFDVSISKCSVWGGGDKAHLPWHLVAWQFCRFPLILARHRSLKYLPYLDN